jgi:hypothetical protein
MPVLTGTVEAYPLAGRDDPAAHASARTLIPQMEHYLDLLSQATDEPFNLQQLPADPVTVAYLAAMVVQAPLEEKQELLNIASATDLLDHERALYRREVSLLRAMLTDPQGQNKAPFLPN